MSKEMQENKHSGLVIKSVLPNLFEKLAKEANQKRLENNEKLIVVDKIHVFFDDKEIEFTDELPDDICDCALTRKIVILVKALSEEALADFKKIQIIVKKVEWMEMVFFELYLQWNIYKKLFFIDRSKEKDNSKPWFDICPSWFLIAIRSSLIDSVFVNLCKIMRTEKEKNSKAKLIINSLIDEMGLDTDKKVLFLKQYESLEKKVNESIRLHRNKKIAHIDKKLVLGEISLKDIPSKEIDEIISDFESLFTNISNYLTSCTFSYKSADVEIVIERMADLLNMGVVSQSYKDYLSQYAPELDKNTSIFNPAILESVEKNEYAKRVKERIKFLEK